MKKLSLIFLIFLAFGCTNLNKKEDGNKLQRRNLEEYYVESGIVTYFLPILPQWANYSLEGSCRRARSMRYLDFQKMKSSFGFNYEQLVQFQLLYNSRVWSSLAISNLDFIPFKDAERFFFEVSDSVHAGNFLFRLPNYNRIHVIWIDDYLNSQSKIKKLKKILDSKDMTQGFPVFASLCMARIDLQKLIKTNGLDHGSYELLTYEMFSPYDSDFTTGLEPSINLDAFFGKKAIYFYGKNIPKVINGKKIIHRKL